jgi:hypothetical protein
VATCLGHKRGTGCHKNSRSPKARNWKDHQLCYSCYCIIILDIPPKKGHGGKYQDKQENGGMSLIATQ